MTPEDIVRAYDTLALADVSATIAYYLRHLEEVQDCLAQRMVDADTLRATIEAHQPRTSRDALVARSGTQEQPHAPTGQ